MRLLVLFHRWVGVVLSLMFATWFATGAMMVFVAFPSLGASDAARGSAAIRMGAVAIGPDIARGHLADSADLRLIDRDSTPVYVAAVAGHATVLSAVDGARLPAIDGPVAARIAAAFGRAPVKRLDGPFDYDQWVVHQQFDPVRPVFRARLEDAPGTELYVSARTGEVIQRTVRYERACNWLGSVIHWIYIVPIRRSFALWDWTVWIVSLVGLASVTAGLTLGISRTVTRLRAGQTASPFKGLLRWHHLLGLCAGLFVACWITSGWLSMDHGRLFSDGEAGPSAIARYRDGPAPTPRRLEPADLRALQGASVVRFGRVAGREVAAADGPGLGPIKVLTTGSAGVQASNGLPPDLLIKAVRYGWPGEQIVEVSPVIADSPYAKAEGLGSSARLIRLTGPTSERLYVDGQSGRVMVVMDRSRAAYAWVYYMLHTYNFPGLSDRPVLRITLLLIPLSAGFAFSITGLLAAVRRLRLTVRT